MSTATGIVASLFGNPVFGNNQLITQAQPISLATPGCLTYPATPLPGRNYAVRQPKWSYVVDKIGTAILTDKFRGYADWMISNGNVIDNLRQRSFVLIVGVGSHPIFPALILHKLSINQCEGVLDGEAVCEWRGLAPLYSNNPPPPVYTLDVSCSQEPLTTHPGFTSAIAGTADKTLNGAIFFGKDGYKWTSPAQGPASEATFQGFQINSTANPSPFYGIESYFVPGSTWTASFTTLNQNLSNDGVGTFTTPDGNPPTPQGFGWIYLGTKIINNSGCFKVDRSWKLGGLTAASQIIYSVAATPSGGGGGIIGI